MSTNLFFDSIQILQGSKEKVRKDAVFIEDGILKNFGDCARTAASKAGVEPTKSNHKIIAPCLVDPHSILTKPLDGVEENIASLQRKASIGGYGQVALLPEGKPFRDNPEMIKGISVQNSDVEIHLWGSFSIKGESEKLSRHEDLLNSGAIGLSENYSRTSMALLKQGLDLGETGKAPILVSPIDEEIQAKGIVRESIEALRAGWRMDPIQSETIPLSQIIELQRCHPHRKIEVMNISTSAGVSMLYNLPFKLMASVCWWHVLKDSSSLKPFDLGWKMKPSLGGPSDRLSLIQGLKEKTLTAIAVNAVPLNDNQTKQPTESREAGISSYDLVLPLLWRELVILNEWPIEQLWETLSFGPSKMIGSKEEELKEDSNRWIIFDPDVRWENTNNEAGSSSTANKPCLGQEIIGRVTHCGLQA